MPLDLITKMLLERQMASHQKPDPNAPGMDIGIAPVTTPEGDLTTGSFNSMLARGDQRAGLPGDTPLIDPRLINPQNSPLTSLEGMKRGDITLPGRRTPASGFRSEHGSSLSPYQAGEDLTNLMSVIEAHKRIK